MAFFSDGDQIISCLKDRKARFSLLDVESESYNFKVYLTLTHRSTQYPRCPRRLRLVLVADHTLR